MPLIDVGIGGGVRLGSVSGAETGAAAGAGVVGGASGCGSDVRTTGTAGSFESDANVKSKRCSGWSPPNFTFAVISAGSVADSIQRKRFELGCRARRRVERFLGDHSRLHVLDPGSRELPAEVVVDVEPEHARGRMDAFKVMPVVGRHEELAAVLRIVIAVGAKRPSSDARRTIPAGAGFEVLGGPIGAAGPRERHRHRHELTPAHAARAGA